MTEIGFHYKSMESFLHDKDLRRESVKYNTKKTKQK